MEVPASQPALVFITIFWSHCLHSLPISSLSLHPVIHQIPGFDQKFIFWSLLCIHLSLSWSSLSLSLVWTATWCFCPAVLLPSHQLALASWCFWTQTQALHPRIQSFFVIVWSPISPHPNPINSTLVPGTIRHHFLLHKMTFNGKGLRRWH